MPSPRTFPLLQRSIVAHFITGVLQEDSMVEAFVALCRSVSLQPGARVKTMRGSLRGQVMRLLGDGRVVWKPNGRSAELIALPESLLPDE